MCQCNNAVLWHNIQQEYVCAKRKTLLQHIMVLRMRLDWLAEFVAKKTNACPTEEQHIRCTEFRDHHICKYCWLAEANKATPPMDAIV